VFHSREEGLDLDSVNKEAKEMINASTSRVALWQVVLMSSMFGFLLKDFAEC
jgi:hypothetical protein